ncbi:Uncharacterised protein [Collinsella intestinalis]|nr:Uncharacterised protein [Collinsella intestinalis]
MTCSRFARPPAPMRRPTSPSAGRSFRARAMWLRERKCSFPASEKSRRAAPCTWSARRARFWRPRPRCGRCAKRRSAWPPQNPRAWRPGRVSRRRKPVPDVKGLLPASWASIARLPRPLALPMLAVAEKMGRRANRARAVRARSSRVRSNRARAVLANRLIPLSTSAKFADSRTSRACEPLVSVSFAEKPPPSWFATSVRFRRFVPPAYPGRWGRRCRCGTPRLPASWSGSVRVAFGSPRSSQWRTSRRLGLRWRTPRRVTLRRKAPRRESSRRLGCIVPGRRVPHLRSLRGVLTPSSAIRATSSTSRRTARRPS